MHEKNSYFWTLETTHLSFCSWNFHPSFKLLPFYFIFHSSSSLCESISLSWVREHRDKNLPNYRERERGREKRKMQSLSQRANTSLGTSLVILVCCRKYMSGEIEEKTSRNFWLSRRRGRKRGRKKGWERRGMNNMQGGKEISRHGEDMECLFSFLTHPSPSSSISLSLSLFLTLIPPYMNPCVLVTVLVPLEKQKKLHWSFSIFFFPSILCVKLICIA